MFTIRVTLSWLKKRTTVLSEDDPSILYISRYAENEAMRAMPDINPALPAVHLPGLL